jgi:dihydrofolate reductase
VRRLQLFVATSVDGFVAGRGGDVSWRVAGEELFATPWSHVDTVLMGWRSYAAACSAGWSPGARRIVVFGGASVPPIATAQTVATARPVAEVVRELRARSGGSLALVCGGALASACFAAQLVDDVFVVVHPVLLGAGTRWMDDGVAATPLATVAERRHPSGVVQITYRVERSAVAPDARAGGAPTRD